MKRTLTVAALFLSLAVLGSQAVTAGPGNGPGGYGPGNCQGPANCGGPCAQSGVSPEARQAFFDETAELRNQLFEKRQAYQEVLNQDPVNKEMAAQLWSEIFDLQTQIREKAAAAGLPAGQGGCGGGMAMMGGGCGNGPNAGGCGKGGCNGRGPRGN